MSLLIIMILFINLIRHFHVIIEGDRIFHNLTRSCSSLDVLNESTCTYQCLFGAPFWYQNLILASQVTFLAYEKTGLTTHKHSQWLLFSLFNPLTSGSET